MKNIQRHMAELSKTAASAVVRFAVVSVCVLVLLQAAVLAVVVL